MDSRIFIILLNLKFRFLYSQILGAFLWGLKYSTEALMSEINASFLFLDVRC
jgi:hypothetical protein